MASNDCERLRVHRSPSSSVPPALTENESNYKASFSTETEYDVVHPPDITEWTLVKSSKHHESPSSHEDRSQERTMDDTRRTLHSGYEGTDIQRKVLLPKILNRFTSVIEKSEEIKRLGVSMRFEQSRDNLVCMLTGSTNNVIDAETILKGLHVITEQINFTHDITDALKHIPVDVEDLVNDHLKNNNLACFAEQLKSGIYLHGFDKLMLSKAKISVSRLFTKRSHLLVGSLREKAQLVKQHLENRFQEGLFVDINCAFRLDFVGVAQAVAEANAEFLDISEGRKSLSVQGVFPDFPQKVKETYKFKHSQNIKFVEKFDVLKQVSDKFQVRVVPDRMACTIDVTGTRENTARAVEYINQIDTGLSTDSIDTTMPEKTFSTLESYHEYRQNFHVLLVRTDVVSFGQLQITKQSYVESCSWSRCQANLLILERPSHKDVEADIKFVPVGDKPGQGERCVTKDHGGIIEADIPIPTFGIDNHTACEKVELMTRKAIGKASSGKAKFIAFLVSPVEHWKMDDLMACIAKGCVDWLLHSTDEYPRSVLLCTEDQDNFRTTDGYIDKYIRTKMRDTSTGHLEPKLKVIPGHLDKIEADVIVNTTDTRLDLSNGKVSNALLRAAGQNLQQECIKRYPKGIRRGEVAVTHGYNLSCREVFHIALGTQSKPEEFMQSVRNAMRLCLKKASEHEFRSIAFPAIGTGSLQYPTDLVASEMVMSIERFIQEVSSTTLQDILFVIHPKSKEVLEVFQKMGRKLWKPNSSATQGNVDVSTRFEITGTKEDVKQCKKMISSTHVEKTHRLHGEMAESHVGLSSHARFSWSAHTANSRLYKCGNVVIRVYKADICNVPVECIVNAANGDLQHDGGIAYVIAQACGGQLRKECRNIINEKGSIPMTNVVKTSAGNLPYKYVLHAVGPCFYNYRPVTVSSLQACGQDLKQTVLTCLNMCVVLKIETIAIPSISSGIFGVPRDVCAAKYAEALVEFCTNNQTIKEIHFVDTLHDMVDIMHKTFNAMITQRKPPPFDMNVYVERTTTVATGGNTGVNRTTTVATDGNTGVNRTSMIENTERKPKQPKFDKDMDESTYEHNRIKNTARDRPKYSSKKAQTKIDVSCSFISGNKQTHCSFVNREGLEVEVLIYEGNIVRLTGPEAVVCSESSTGDGRGKVANLLLNEGGQTYKNLKRLQFTSPRKYGEVITTPGGGNKYTWVMHGVVSRKDRDCIPILYKNLLKETKTRELSSVALPLLGTGVGTLDPRSSAEMLFYELINFCNTNDTAAFTLHVVLNEKVVADTAKDVFKRKIDAIMKKQESPVLESDLKLQEGTSRTDKNVSSQQRETHSEIEDCVICMDRVTDAKKLNCGHLFCTDCIEGYFRVKQVCPTCGKVCGIVTGDQPDGSMEIVKRVSPIAGYEQYKSIAITYSFGNGMQGDNHPRPGSPFKGISRTAYLPDSIDGREVCAMLKVAFQRRLVFTIGTSRTTGKEGVITWNDIHHKTDMIPHTQFGYPDTTYLQRVREELKAKGVTVQDIEKAFLKELKRDIFRLTVTAE